MEVSVSSAVFCSPDLLHLRRPRQREQGGLRGLHDLQQAGLQAGFPRHLVGVGWTPSVVMCALVVLWLIYTVEPLAKLLADIGNIFGVTNKRMPLARKTSRSTCFLTHKRDV